MSKNIKLKSLITEEKHFVNPICPQCHRYNSMLSSHEKKGSNYGEEVRKCRDCGFEADYTYKEKIDIGNNTETYKRIDGEDGKLKEDMTYQPDKRNLSGGEVERFGNYKIHKFKNLYHAVGKDLDLTAYDNNGKIIAGGIDKNTFRPKSYEDIVQHLVSFYKANPQAQSVDLSDRQTGESLAAMQRTKFDEVKLKEDSTFNYHKHEIDNFLSKCDTNSPYKPQIKLNWGGDTGSSSTKWLSIDWGIMMKLANLLKDNE